MEKRTALLAISFTYPGTVGASSEISGKKLLANLSKRKNPHCTATFKGLHLSYI
jgi:hypothetical protein